MLSSRHEAPGLPIFLWITCARTHVLTSCSSIGLDGPTMEILKKVNIEHFGKEEMR